MGRILKIMAVGLVTTGAMSAQAQNLVVNGDFEVVTNGAGLAQAAGENYMINSTVFNPNWGFNMPGWKNDGYYAVAYGSGVSDSPDHQVKRSDGLTQANAILAGSHYDPTLPVLPTSSPAGGNFFGTNGDYNKGSLSQTVSGLVVGQSYTLSFWSAAAVSAAGVYPGGPKLTGSWAVSLIGATTDVNQTVTSKSYGPVGGYSDWVQTIINFTASSTSELLTFAPGGSAPPMDLLDGVAIMAGKNVVPAIPEPAQWALMGAGLLLVGARLRRRRTA